MTSPCSSIKSSNFGNRDCRCEHNAGDLLGFEKSRNQYIFFIKGVNGGWKINILS